MGSPTASTSRQEESWVSGLGFRVSGLGFRVSGLGLHPSSELAVCMTHALYKAGVARNGKSKATSNWLQSQCQTKTAWGLELRVRLFGMADNNLQTPKRRDPATRRPPETKLQHHAIPLNYAFIYTSFLIMSPGTFLTLLTYNPKP